MSKKDGGYADDYETHPDESGWDVVPFGLFLAGMLTGAVLMTVVLLD